LYKYNYTFILTIIECEVNARSRNSSSRWQADRDRNANAPLDTALPTDIRMTLAANELRTSFLSTGAMAETVGYQSEAAFQRAFKSHMVSRGAVAQDAATVRQDVFEGKALIASQ
jgi:hypothetical protein